MERYSSHGRETEGTAVCIDNARYEVYSQSPLSRPKASMRTYIASALLLAVLVTATPSQAQLRADLPGRTAATAVQTAPGTGLGNIFASDRFRLQHSYEFSYSSFGAGESMGLGVYTSSLQWQPSDRLAARVDVGVAHSPFGTGDIRSAMGFDADTPARVFLRNAEVAYRPSENSVIRLQIQQSPYGNYASPYGHGYSQFGNPFGFDRHRSASSFRIQAGGDDATFWRSGR